MDKPMMKPGLKSPLKDADLSVLSIQRPDDPENAPREGRWRRILATGLIAAFAAAAGYLAGPSREHAIDVEVMTVVSARTGSDEIASELAASGYVVAQKQAQVASKGTGRLELLTVQVGDRVQTGQVIARLERADMTAGLIEAQARLEVANAALANARPELQDATVNHERLRALVVQAYATQAEFDVAVARLRRARAAVRSAEAAINAAAAELQAAKVQLENTNIRAPFDGTVVKKFAEVGEVVAPLAASAISRGAVVQIADLTSLMVEAEVSESMIGRVQMDNPVEIAVDAIPDRRYRGAVHQIVPTADRSKATIMTKIRFMESDDRILPEMSAKVSIRTRPAAREPASTPPLLGVPTNAIMTRNGRTSIFLIVDGVARERAVSVGRQAGTLTEVMGDFVPGAEIVANPPAHLKDGTHVTKKER